MSDLIVVSNRGPHSFSLDGTGQPVATGPAGGLAGTLGPLMAGTNSLWVAAAMDEADTLAAKEGLVDQLDPRVVMVTADHDTYVKAYDVVSNAALWFTHHYLFDLARRPRFDRHFADAFDAYVDLNRQFADAVVANASPGARVLVQDYHLSLLGSMLAERRRDLRTVHFSHTPFADATAMRVLPDKLSQAVVEGMAGFGACGFHTERWATSFESVYRDRLFAPLAPKGSPTTFVAPLGPDVDAIVAAAEQDECQRERAALDELVDGRRVIVRVDRVELSKNLLRGFFAFEELLELRPDLQNEVVFLALEYASRESLAEYQAYRSEVESCIERINHRFGTASWQPIILDLADHPSRSMAALCNYDVLLVNPIRDGLNLVVKEGVLVNQRDGAVVLSREAGAYEELGADCLGINPFDVTDTANALARALEMPADERRRRAAALRQAVAANPAREWLKRQLAAADAIAS